MGKVSHGQNWGLSRNTGIKRKRGKTPCGLGSLVSPFFGRAAAGLADSTPAAAAALQHSSRTRKGSPADIQLSVAQRTWKSKRFTFWKLDENGPNQETRRVKRMALRQ